MGSCGRCDRDGGGRAVAYPCVSLRNFACGAEEESFFFYATGRGQSEERRVPVEPFPR